MTRDQLITDNVTLARSVSRLYWPRNGYTRNDLSQEAMVALVKAVDIHLTDGSVNLPGLVTRLVHHHLTNIAVAQKRRPHEGPLSVDFDTLAAEVRQ